MTWQGPEQTEEVIIRSGNSWFAGYRKVPFYDPVARQYYQLTERSDSVLAAVHRINSGRADSDIRLAAADLIDDVSKATPTYQTPASTYEYVSSGQLFRRAWQHRDVAGMARVAFNCVNAQQLAQIYGTSHFHCRKTDQDMLQLCEKHCPLRPDTGIR